MPGGRGGVANTARILVTEIPNLARDLAFRESDSDPFQSALLGGISQRLNAGESEWSAIGGTLFNVGANIVTVGLYSQGEAIASHLAGNSTLAQLDEQLSEAAGGAVFAAAFGAATSSLTRHGWRGPQVKVPTLASMRAELAQFAGDVGAAMARAKAALADLKPRASAAWQRAKLFAKAAWADETGSLRIGPFGKGPGKRVLNIGSGENPISDAVNLEARKGIPGTNLVGDAEALPFQPGTFDEVVSINPKDYNPLADAARVLQPGGRIHIVAQGTNNRVFRQIGRMSSEHLAEFGFRRVHPGRIQAEPRFIFGQAKKTTGEPLYMGKAQQITLERISLEGR